MSGHSKWSTIKHKKAAIDAKRGAVFTRLAREVTVATRAGASGDPAMNFRLRLIMDKAKAANMPAENVDRAIKKGLGIGSDGAVFEEITYEGYSPGGAAIMLMARVKAGMAMRPAPVVWLRPLWYPVLSA